MKKVFLRWLLSGVITFELMGGCMSIAHCDAEVVSIGIAEDFVRYCELINSGQQKDAVLTADIDLKDLSDAWTPIGNTASNKFSSVFDGCGYTIGGLDNTDASQTDTYGLFGYTDAKAVIKNVTVKGTIKGKRAGGIAGESDGRIQNCISMVNIDSQSYAGGIAAVSHGEIEDCTNFGEISTKSDFVGGIAGYTNAAVDNCKNYGFISGNSKVGGVVGSGLSLSNCINYGDVTAVGQHGGGVIGLIKAANKTQNVNVIRCANKGEVNAGKWVGGIIGCAYIGAVNVAQCTNDGKVTGSGEWVGGIIGVTSNWEDYSGKYKIDQCANRAPVHGVGNYTGGIVGYMLVGDIVNSYNTGKITSILTPGGIAAYARKGSTTIKNTFNYSNITLCFSDAQCENVYSLKSNVDEQKKTVDQFKDGTVLNLINSDNVWVQGNDYPINKELLTIEGITSADELKNALADTNVNTIELASNIELNETINIDRDVRINGNGYKLSGNDTIFDIKSANIHLSDIAFEGKGILIKADSGNIKLEGVVRMYNLANTAMMLDDTILFLDECQTFYTMPGYAVSSNVEQTFDVKNIHTVIDDRHVYTFNTEGSMFSKISNIVLKAENNEGLSYDVYGFIKAGNLYIMVPSCVDLSNCVYTQIGEDGSQYDTLTADFTSGEKYQVQIGAVSYNIVAMQSKLPTLYIDIDEQYGTIRAMNTSEDHSVSAYGDITIDVPQDLVDKYGWSAKYKSAEGDADTPGTAKIRGRGNSTWTTSEFRKKPYQVKTEKKLDILGMGKSKTWCLIKDGGYFVGQKLGLDLGLAMGLSCTPDSRFVDVYMNGEYLGCYTMTEKVQIKENRVEITDLEDIVDKNGITPETDLTGGYLMEIDNYSNDPIVIKTNGNEITVKSPENLDEKATKDNNYSYIYNLMDDLFNAIYGDGLMSDGTSYLEHIDIESFVRYYWHQELIENMDCGIGSTYLYKDTDSVNPKIFAGPIWDNDNIFKSEDNVEKWYAKNIERYGNVKTLYNQLMHRKDFVSYAIWYYENSDIKEKMASSVDIVEGYKDTLGIADDMDFAKWGVNTFDDGKVLLSYLKRRLAWIDANYKSLMDEATVGEEIDVDSILGNLEPNPIINDGSYASFKFSNGQSSKALNKSYGSFDTGYYATHGVNEGALLKAFIDKDTNVPLVWSAPEYMYNANAAVVPTVSATAENGWKNQEENPAFVQIELPMQGYKDAAFSAKLAATKKGPKNYKLLYSVDSNEFKELGRYSLSANKKFEQAFENVALPKECDNAQKVYIRIAVMDNQTVGGLNLTDNPASGEFAIQDLIITKYEVPLDYSISSVKLLDISGNETDSIYGKTDFDVKVDFKKIINKDESASLIAAVYDENGILVEIRSVNIDTQYPYSASMSFRFNQKEKTLKKVKVFIWNSINNQMPLCPCGEKVLQ